MPAMKYPAPHSEDRNWRPWLVDILIGLIGFTIVFTVNLVGELFVCEVLLLLLLPYLLLRSQPLMETNRTQRMVLTLGFFWLLSQLTADLVHGSSFHDWSRGFSKISFVLLNFIALRRLLNSNRRILLFGVGLAVGTGAKLIEQGWVLDVLWKFGLGTTVAIGLMAISSGTALKRFPWVAPLMMLGIAVFSAAQGTRNMAGVSLIAASLLAVSLLLRKHLEVSLAARVLAAVSLVAMGMLAYVGMGALTASGYLGEKQKLKYQSQIKRGEGSLLLGGRSEWRASLMAIGDSPILGHGSWAKGADYANRYRAKLNAESGETYQAATNDDLIPTHSFVMGAWVEAGIFGAIFWVGVLCLIATSLFSLLTWRPPLGPLAVFLATLLVWDIPFSPFGGERRLQVAYILVLLPIAAAQARTSQMALPIKRPIKGPPLGEPAS